MVHLAARGARLSCSDDHIFPRRVLIYLRDHGQTRSRDLRTAKRHKNEGWQDRLSPVLGAEVLELIPRVM
jgi:hypothetical protein